MNNSKNNDLITEGKKEEVQPSPALALNAILTKVEDEYKPYVMPVLKQLPDKVVIGIAATFAPDAKITIDLNNVDAELAAANLKVQEHNERKAKELANNPNISTITADKVLGAVVAHVRLATGNNPGTGKIPEKDSKADNALKNSLASITESKNRTLKNFVVKNEKIELNKELDNEAKVQADSFIIDKKTNDQKTIDARLKELLSYKEFKARDVKDSIVKNVTNNKMQKVEKIIKRIIDERNNIMNTRRYLKALSAAELLINSYKLKNSSEVDKQINLLTNNEEVKSNIALAIAEENRIVLIDEIKTILKGRETNQKINDPKTIVTEIVNLLKQNKGTDAINLIESIVNSISAEEYSKQIKDDLNTNNLISLKGSIYKILLEKRTEQDRIIRKIAKKAGIKLASSDIEKIRDEIISGNTTSRAGIISKGLLESRAGRILLIEFKNKSDSLINDSKQLLKNISTTPIVAKTTDTIKSTLNDIKQGNLKNLADDAKKIIDAKNAAEKKLIVGTAAKLGIHVSDKNYDKIKIAIGMTTPVGIAKTIVSQIGKTETGKKLMDGIKNRTKSLLNKNKHDSAQAAINTTSNDLERAKIDAQLNPTEENKKKVQLLEKRLAELRNVSGVYKTQATNDNAVIETKALVDVAKNQRRIAEENLKKVKDALESAKNNPVVQKTLNEASKVASNVLSNASKVLEESQRLAKEKAKAAIESAKKLTNVVKSNPSVVKIVDNTIAVKDKIASIPAVIAVKDAGKSALTAIKNVSVKGLVNDAIALNKAKADLEKKVIVSTAAKLGINVSDKNYDKIRLGLAMTTPIGAAKVIATKLGETNTGKKIFGNIRNKVSNAMKHKKADDAKSNAQLLADEAKRIAADAKSKLDSAKKSKDTLVKISAEEAKKDADEAKKKADEAARAAKILADHAKASSAATEVRGIVEVAQMKVDAAKRIVAELTERLKRAQEASKSKSKVNIAKDLAKGGGGLANEQLSIAQLENEIRLAKKAVEKAELQLAAAQIEVRKSQQTANQSGNKVTNYLANKPAIQAQINKIGETKESAKKAVEALKAGDKKEVINAAKDLAAKANQLKVGAYKSVGAAVGIELSDNNVKELEKARKALKAMNDARKAAKAAKAAGQALKASTKMKNLMKGPAAIIIAVIAIILEKTLKLDEDDFGKCNPGDFDLNNIPGWAKKVIDLIPGLGELFDLIGNKLCIKQGCPAHKPSNENGLCYPNCQPSFRSDGAMICWKQYPDFERASGRGSTITSITKRIDLNTGTIPDRCRPGEDKNGALCYPPCKPGYTGVGPVCWENCREGNVDIGLICAKGSYGRGVGRIPDRRPCPDGFRNDPVTCWKDLKCNTWWDGCASRAPGWLGGGCIGGAKTSCSGPEARGRDAYCRDENIGQRTRTETRTVPGACRPGNPCASKRTINVVVGMERAGRWGFRPKYAKREVCVPGPQVCDPPRQSQVQVTEAIVRAGDMQAGLCYTPCRDGFSGVGPVCWSNAPDYVKKSYGRGVGNPLTCAPGLNNIAGLCYKQCPPGFTMQSLGLCSQICPPGSTDFGVGCTRESYNRGVGDVPFNIYMRPRKAGVQEDFTNISNMIDYYTVETFSNYDTSAIYETAFEGFENSENSIYETAFEGFNNNVNSAEFLELFYNVDNTVNILEKYNNGVQFEHFSDAIEYNNADNYGFNEAFENIEQFNIQNGAGLEGFAFVDASKNKEICENGFCGIPVYKTYSQYEMLHNYAPKFGFYAPSIKHSSKSKLQQKQLPGRPQDNRAINETRIVSPKFGSFAPIDKLPSMRASSVKSTGSTASRASTASIASSVLSIDSTISARGARQLTPKTGSTPKLSPFTKQAIKTLAKSFPVDRTTQVRLARRAMRNMKDVKKLIGKSDVKGLAKAVMTQVKMNPPMIVIKPRIEEKFYELASENFASENFASENFASENNSASE